MYQASNQGMVGQCSTSTSYVFVVQDSALFHAESISSHCSGIGSEKVVFSMIKQAARELGLSYQPRCKHHYSVDTCWGSD